MVALHFFYNEPCQQLRQSGAIHRLDQVVIEPSARRLLPVLVLSPARHGDQKHVLVPSMLSHLSTSLVAVQLRQANVAEHHVRPEFQRCLHSLFAVVCRVDFVAHHFEQLRQRDGSVSVVVDYQDAKIGGWRYC